MKKKMILQQFCWNSEPMSFGTVFKNGPSKICGRQPLKNREGYGITLQIF